MPEIHARFFASFGLLIGALYGFVFSVWMPTRTVIITDLYDPMMWAIAILSFFILQYGLGVLLNKPNMSREIYFGVLLIPITYVISVMSISFPNVLQTLIVVEIPALVLFLTSFYFVSPFIAFFAGYDTKVLDSSEIPAGTIFSFDIQYLELAEGAKDGEDLRLLTRIVNGLGLTILRKNKSDTEGLLICQKEELHIGIFYEFRNSVLKATFIPFKIINDIVKKVENSDEMLDFRAQISGMLYAWVQNKLILRFNESSPNLKQGFKQVSEGLGPLRKSLIMHLKESTVAFPKNHPYRLALLTTGFVILLNVMLFILGKIVFK